MSGMLMPDDVESLKTKFKKHNDANVIIDSRHGSVAIPTKEADFYGVTE